MGYFPMCMDLCGKTVLLVGSGPQIKDKAARLAPFRATLVYRETLREEDLAVRPAFVIIGDLSEADAEQAAALCMSRHVPVNVVDMPRLCTFFFPSMVVRGDVTVSISTGGKAPGAAAYLNRQIAQLLPEQTEALLDWLAQVRTDLRRCCPAPERARLMRELTAAAFAKGDVLTRQEYLRITGMDAPASPGE